MADNNKRMQKSPQQRFLLILGMVMFAFYLALGIIIIFWDDIPLSLSQNYRILFGVVLIVYAFFRFIRLVQTRKD